MTEYRDVAFDNYMEEDVEYDLANVPESRNESFLGGAQKKKGLMKSIFRKSKIKNILEENPLDAAAELAGSQLSSSHSVLERNTDINPKVKKSIRQMFKKKADDFAKQ